MSILVSRFTVQAIIDEEKAKRFGIDGYLMKPASMSTIANAIRKVLDR